MGERASDGAGERLAPGTVVAPSLVRLSDLPTEKTACVETLLSLAVETGRVSDAEATRAAVFEREATATTAVGHGIAIPHAKTAGVERPTVVFGRSRSAVDYETPDDVPVGLVVLLLVPADADDAHLTLLSRLSRSLVDPAFRERLREAASASAVVETLRSALAGDDDHQPRSK